MSIDKHYHLGVSLSTLVKDIEGERQVEVLKDRPETEAKDTEDLRKRSEAAPIVRMVNLIIAQAVDQGASDIHIEPGKTQVAIRTASTASCASRSKPRNGCRDRSSRASRSWRGWTSPRSACRRTAAFAVRVSEKSLDLRVSTVPSAHGEKVVIRVLDPPTPHAARAGRPRRPRAQVVESLLRRPQGLILVTGPTGSGKTSTLYAMLNHVNRWSATSRRSKIRSSTS